MKEKKKIKIVVFLIFMLFFINTLWVIKNNVNAEEKDEVILHTVVGKDNRNDIDLKNENNLMMVEKISNNEIYKEIDSVNTNNKMSENNIIEKKEILEEESKIITIKTADIVISDNNKEDNLIKEDKTDVEEKSEILDVNNLIHYENEKNNLELSDNLMIDEYLDDNDLQKNDVSSNHELDVNHELNTNNMPEDENSHECEGKSEENEFIQNLDNNIGGEVNESILLENDLYTGQDGVDQLIDLEYGLNDSNIESRLEDTNNYENGEGENREEQKENEDNNMENVKEENGDNDLELNEEESEEIYYITDENGKMTNISEKLHETKYADGLEISNIKLTCVGNMSSISANVKNINNETMPATMLLITMLDNKGNVIVNIKGYVSEMFSGQTRKLSASASYNFVNAYDLVIETIK